MDYLTFWSNNNNTFSGIGLLVRNQWAQYIHRVEDLNERFLYIDLYIKGNIKLRVYNVYLHANLTQKTDRISLQNQILFSINQELAANFHIIVMEISTLI